MVGAVGCAGKQQMQCRPRQVLGEGGAPPLIRHDGRIHAAFGQRCHSRHKIFALADHPAGAQQVVFAPRGRGALPRGLGGAIYAQRGDGMLHRVFLPYRQSSVEDVVGGNMHERKIRFFADAR